MAYGLEQDRLEGMLDSLEKMLDAWRQFMVFLWRGFEIKEERETVKAFFSDFLKRHE